jgi:hypothetical protein
VGEGADVGPRWGPWRGGCRCLAALAEWERLSELCAKEWKRQDPIVRREMASWAAHAAWHMGDWDSMAAYTATLKDTADTPAARLNAEFLSGVLLAHHGEREAAACERCPPPPALKVPGFGGGIKCKKFSCAILCKILL